MVVLKPIYYSDLPHCGDDEEIPNRMIVHTKEEVIKRELRIEHDKLELLLSRYEDDPSLRPSDTTYLLSFHNKHNFFADYQKIDCKVEFQIFGDKYHTNRITTNFQNFEINSNEEKGVEIELEKTCDVGEIMIIYLHNLSLDFNFYLEYFIITNKRTGEGWEVPVYDWFGAHKMNCKISHLLWAHPLTPDPSWREPSNFDIVTSSIIDDYDPLREKPFLKYSFVVINGNYKWKVERRYCELYIMHLLVCELGREKGIDTELLTSIFPHRSSIPNIEKHDLHLNDEYKRDHLASYFREVFEHFPLFVHSPEFRAKLVIPPLSLRLGKLKLGSKGKSNLNLSNKKNRDKKGNKKGFFYSIKLKFEDTLEHLHLQPHHPHHHHNNNNNNNDDYHEKHEKEENDC